IMISAPGATAAPNPTPGQTGTVFMTSGPSLGYGVQWFPIGVPGEAFSSGGGTWDNAYSPAEAFGAPAVGSASLDSFLYVGTSLGHIYVTFTGGGVAGTPWKNI